MRSLEKLKNKEVEKEVLALRMPLTTAINEETGKHINCQKRLPVVIWLVQARLKQPTKSEDVAESSQARSKMSPTRSNLWSCWRRNLQARWEGWSCNTWISPKHHRHGQISLVLADAFSVLLSSTKWSFHARKRTGSFGHCGDSKAWTALLACYSFVAWCWFASDQWYPDSSIFWGIVSMSPPL